MISFLIISLTIVFISILIKYTRMKANITKIFKLIKKYYSDFFDQQEKCMKILLILYCVFMTIACVWYSFKRYCLVNNGNTLFVNILLSVFTGAIAFLIIYFGFGITLAILFKTITIINSVKDKDIEPKMMIAFLWLMALAVFSIMSEKELKEDLNLHFLFGGLVICYILNMQIIFRIIKNPFCIIEDKNKSIYENKVLIVFSSFLILIMIILNTYLFVLWSYFSFEGAYSCCGSVTKWDLLYYTIISFTTVGYGDIYPAIFASQAVAVLISITSVICLVVFISAILSVKNDIFQKGQDDLMNENK